MRFALSTGPCTLAVAMLCTLTAAAQDQPESNAEQDVRKAGQHYLVALRRGDAEELVRCWTEDGVYIDSSGRNLPAREMIATEFAPAAHGDEPQAKGALSSTIRFVRSDVAIEDGTFQIEANDDGSTALGRFTAVWVLHDGRWLLDSLRDWGAGGSSNHDRVSQLAWLIGDWIGRNDQSNLVATVRWSDDGNYILCEFSASDPHRGTMRGSQRIGWDPLSGGLKSWTFQSDGGYSLGYWTRMGEAWRVEQSGVLPDGEETSVVNYFEPSDDGRWTLRSTAATVGDATLADMVVLFERQEDVR